MTAVQIEKELIQCLEQEYLIPEVDLRTGLKSFRPFPLVKGIIRRDGFPIHYNEMVCVFDLYCMAKDAISVARPLHSSYRNTERGRMINKWYNAYSSLIVNNGDFGEHYIRSRQRNMIEYFAYKSYTQNVSEIFSLNMPLMNAYGMVLYNHTAKEYLLEQFNPSPSRLVDANDFFWIPRGGANHLTHHLHEIMLRYDDIELLLNCSLDEIPLVIANGDFSQLAVDIAQARMNYEVQYI